MTRAASPWWLVLAFVLALPAVTPRIYASDEIQYFAYLRSLWFDRDVSFENDYRRFYERGVAADAGFHETFLERTTETGRRINFATLGCAILWSPFYAAADAWVAATGRPRDGDSWPYVAAVSYGSAVYGLLALLLGASLARAITGAGTGAAFAVWLGTPLVFYMLVAPPMAHACSAFAVALFVWTWWHVRRRWSVGGAVALGLAGALMAMVREQDAFFAAGPALDLLLTLREQLWLRHRRESAQLVRAAGAAIAAFVLGLLPQLAAYSALNGYPGPSRLVRRKMDWTAPHFLDVLTSPAHGFLVWTPLAALALAGLAWLALSAGRTREDTEARRRFGLCALLMIGLQVYVAGSVESWTVAGAFGQRRLVAVSALLVVGLAALAVAIRGRRARVALATACALGVWWNLGLIAQFGAGLMDRQRMEPARNAYTSFVVLPRLLPELAYRYAFQRETFYKRAPGTGDAPSP